MRKNSKENSPDITLTEDNAGNIKKVAACYKNILVCGIEGVGKITNTLEAFKENTNVHYIGNPFDYEGKLRPGSYEKYLQYILSLKKDIIIVENTDDLFRISDQIILVIDEIFGRSNEELEQISKLLDMQNIHIIQIVGCMKYMSALINKIDAIIELHLDSAFLIDKELGKAICSIFNRT